MTRMLLACLRHRRHRIRRPCGRHHQGHVHRQGIRHLRQHDEHDLHQGPQDALRRDGGEEEHLDDLRRRRAEDVHPGCRGQGGEGLGHGRLRVEALEHRIRRRHAGVDETERPDQDRRRPEHGRLRHRDRGADDRRRHADDHAPDRHHLDREGRARRRGLLGLLPGRRGKGLDFQRPARSPGLARAGEGDGADVHGVREDRRHPLRDGDEHQARGRRRDGRAHGEGRRHADDDHDRLGRDRPARG